MMRLLSLVAAVSLADSAAAGTRSLVTSKARAGIPCLDPAPAPKSPRPERLVAACADPNDCTLGLQAALDSGASTVVVPKLAHEWAVKPICLRSNQTVLFEPGVVIAAKVGEFHGERDGLLNAVQTSHTRLIGYGATLRMRKADYMNASWYSPSADRSGIWFWAVQHGAIHGLTIASSGGDGISIMRQETDFPIGWCTDIHIKDVACVDNHRQGMSVLSVDGLLVENSRFDTTWGTPPAAGIDIEPIRPIGYRIYNITIRNCSASGNQGGGLLLSTANLNASSYPVSVAVDGFRVDGGGAPRAGGPGVSLTSHLYTPAAGGTLMLRHLDVRNTELCGLCFLSWPAMAVVKGVQRGVHTTVADSTFRNVSANASGAYGRGSSPVLIYPFEKDVVWNMAEKRAVPHVGGVTFSNVSVFDAQPRPWLSFRNVLLGPGNETLVHDVVGNVDVHAPRPPKGKPPACAAEVGSGAAKRGIELNVSCHPA